MFLLIFWGGHWVVHPTKKVFRYTTLQLSTGTHYLHPIMVTPLVIDASFCHFFPLLAVQGKCYLQYLHYIQKKAGMSTTEQLKPEAKKNLDVKTALQSIRKTCIFDFWMTFSF